MEKTYILFCGDVSGSMREPYNKNYNIHKDLPKSDSLFKILEKSIKILSKKNQKAFISSLLFGCTKSQTTDFLSLIDFIIDNISIFKEMIIDNNKDYKILLIELLKRAGAKNIKEYMYRDESPTNIECKYFYKVLKDKPNLVKEIVYELPSAAKDEFTSGMISFGTNLPFFGNSIKERESNTIIEETKRIKEKLKEYFDNCEELKDLNKLKEFDWEVNIPMEKTSDEVLKKLN